MADKKEPLAVGRNDALGDFEIHETANGARLYINSSRFGQLGMQGRKYQEKAKQLLDECRQFSENVENTSKEITENVTDRAAEVSEKITEKPSGFFQRLFGR